MLEATIKWSIANRFLVLLLAVLLAAGGTYVTLRTPVDAIPDLSDVQVIIRTTYPGQAPKVVEDQVTYPLTTAMLSVPRATNVRGYSFFGDSFVYVLFEDGTDLYWARSRVLEYLSQVAPRLPESARPALGPDATGVGWIYQYALADRTGRHDLAQLRSLQDWFLKYELRTVPGVAEVRTGPEMRRGIAELDGEGEVGGGVIVMRWGENALATIRAVKAKLAELSKSLPEGVEIVETYDRSGLIVRAVDTLKEKLVEEFVVVALVCLVFLFHLRSSLVILVTLPLGIVAAFLVMHWQGINANIMSLGGIAIAIGTMVDAAIVMVENLHKHMERTRVTDENRWQVVLQASREVGPPIFFSLMIITLSFRNFADVAIILGALPLSVVGGMVSATALTLVVIPAAFYLWRRHGTEA